MNFWNCSANTGSSDFIFLNSYTKNFLYLPTEFLQIQDLKAEKTVAVNCNRFLGPLCKQHVSFPLHSPQ